MNVDSGEKERVTPGEEHGSARGSGTPLGAGRVQQPSEDRRARRTTPKPRMTVCPGLQGQPCFTPVVPASLLVSVSFHSLKHRVCGDKLQGCPMKPHLTQPDIVILPLPSLNPVSPLQRIWSDSHTSASLPTPSVGA